MLMRWKTTFVLMSFVLCAGCGSRQATDEEQLGNPPMSIQLSSTAFLEGETIPKTHTCDGKDTSPPLRWNEPPQGTKSFVLICDDPDAPRGTWTHWVLFNVPGDARELTEAVPTSETLPSGATQGKNDFGKLGYGGPAPPSGKPHRYYFKLFALDKTLDLSPGTSKDQVIAAMKGHTLAEGQLMGRYQR
jgi:Raf kinase inhibitor-like YbhB/YbcL family protein